MPKIDSHAPGTFCWFELATTNQTAAKQFYSSLFGWAPRDQPMGPDDYYTMFQLGGESAAAAYTLRADEAMLGVPANWGLYVAVENADATAAGVEQLGGRVLAPPFDVFTAGRMSVLADPAGAVIRIWQPNQHRGSGITAEPGTFCWADLRVPNPGQATDFYSKLFGWQLIKAEHDSSGYLHIKAGEEFIGGIPPANLQNPEAPPHWLLYFLTQDCEASTNRAAELGARTILKATFMERVGTVSVLQDPQGAVFALFQSAPALR